MILIEQKCILNHLDGESFSWIVLGLPLIRGKSNIDISKSQKVLKYKCNNTNTKIIASCVYFCTKSNAWSSIEISGFSTHTHTHTHTYIYIYIYIYKQGPRKPWPFQMENQQLRTQSLVREQNLQKFTIIIYIYHHTTRESTCKILSLSAPNQGWLHSLLWWLIVLIISLSSWVGP